MGEGVAVGEGLDSVVGEAASATAVVFSPGSGTVGSTIGVDVGGCTVPVGEGVRVGVIVHVAEGVSVRMVAVGVRLGGGGT